MGNITMSMSMSLDGFIAAKNDSPDEPLGEDGQRLHGWLFRDSNKQYNQVMEAATKSLGAVIIGRRTYDNAHADWGDYGPADDVPSFVLSHDVPPEHNAKMTFVSDGLESALKQARAAAGNKSIDLMGANVQQQFLKAGLIDTIDISIVPVILNEGVRLFDHLGSAHISLKQLKVTEGDQVTHISYAVVKK